MSKMNQFTRLPKSIIPVSYNLWLKPCLEEFVFHGKVDIDVEVRDCTTKIVLNSVDIAISSATYRHKDMAVLESSQVEFQAPDEKVTISFSNNLPTGRGVLSLIFKGDLNDKMKGFYRSRYFFDKEARYGAVTQFEATDARRCFPCWDEPDLKATFEVTLVVPKNRVALSNMNVVSENGEEVGNIKVVKYAKTPIMSTYLLAFVIGEFDFVEGRTSRGLPVRVYTPKGKSKQGQFALEVALKALPYYEDYFNIPYPLPKMDLIAIADFCAGAMENWGLVTYRETALLIDEENSSSSSRQWVSLVVCHELAHQWFGNLVTMEWWTHLWLNEGFASFMEYLATDHCHPEFDIWTQFVSHDFMRGLELDALDNSHPIEVPVGHPNEIDEIFDAISYSKGASIIRMLHNWIGDKCFRQGMHKYLTSHAYKNTFTEDLWEALGEASGKPVRKVMESWTKQMGFPVVHVEVLARSESSATLRVSQRKFQASVWPAQEESSKWCIPVEFCSAESPDQPIKSILLEETDVKVTLRNVSRNSWIKVNPGMYGFYRAQYEPVLLSALLPAVQEKTLPPRDRLGLQNDLFALAGSGVSCTTDFLQALAYYKEETDYSVWSDLDSNINSLSILLWSDIEVLNNFKTIILRLYDATSSSLGWIPKPQESHLSAMLRSLMKHRTGIYGCKKTIAEARERFSRYLLDADSIGADLRSAVYGTVLMHGGSSELDQILSLHDTMELHEEKERIERSLGRVSYDKLMVRVFDFALSDKVRSNDKVFVISSVAVSSPLGRDHSWEFVKENWMRLHDMYKGTFLMSRLVKSTTENFATQEKADEVTEFFQRNPAPAAERTIQQSVENICRKRVWWIRDGKSISEWVSANSAS